MQQKKELIKNTLILTVGKICTQSFSLFLLPIYTSSLTTEEYGLVDLIITYTSLLLPLAYLQFDQAVFRFLIDCRQKTKERKAVMTTVLAFSILQMLLLSGIFSIFQIFIASEYKWYLLYMLLASVASSCMLQIARGLGDIVGYTLGSCVSALVQVAGNILFLLVLDLGAKGMLQATILGHFCAMLFLFVYEHVWRDLSFSSIDPSLLKEMIRYCIPLVPNQLSWWAITASDRVIVSMALGTAFTGLISVGHKFSSLFISIYNIFHLAWSESAVLYINAPEEERNRFFSNVITDMFRLFMCAAIGVIACMPFAFPLLVDDSFRSAYGLVPIFMLATMFHVTTGLYAAIYIALKNTKEVARTSLMAGVINIISHLLLLKSMGIYASAFSSVIGYATMAVNRYVNIQKYVPVRLSRRTICSVAVMYLLVSSVYYCGNLLVQGMVLLMVAIYSVIVNRRLLSDLFAGVKKKLGK